MGTFLTCGKIHHDLALFQAAPDAAPVTKGGLGLNHMALQVEDFEMLTQYFHILKERDLVDHTTDHGMTRSIYLNDPDGNGIELFCNSQEDAADGRAIMSSTERKNTELVFG
jgi:catechol 2,3-dioxygenase